MDILSAERILAGLGTRFVGRSLCYLAETESTNDEARRLAAAGAPDGALVVADHQTAGRGRLGRRWEAPPGCCLLLSLLFRPDEPGPATVAGPALAPHQVQRLTMICGLAAVDAIEATAGLEAGLKWPNDLVLGGAKAGGMLTEVHFSGDRFDHAIVGLGLNVNLDPALLGALPAPATSLSHELGRPLPRLPLLWAFLYAVETRYLALRSGRSCHDEWARRLVTVGRPVTVAAPGRVLEGIAEGVDADGALLVRLADGRLETVLAGDVTLRSRQQLDRLPDSL